MTNQYLTELENAATGFSSAVYSATAYSAHDAAMLALRGQREGTRARVYRLEGSGKRFVEAYILTGARKVVRT